MSPRLLRMLTIAAVFLFILAAALFYLYWQSFTEVTFDINGQRQTVRVRASTVGDAVEAAGILLNPADQIIPDLHTALNETTLITINKAEQVAISDDQVIQRFYTHSTDPVLILQEAGISLKTGDEVLVNGVPYLEYAPGGTPPRIIQIQRIKSIQIDDDGTRHNRATLFETVAGALRSSGFELYLADQITPTLDDPLDVDTVITIERSKPVQVQVDGRILMTRAQGETVGAVLASLGIALGGQDYTIPAEDTPFTSNQQIQVVRVTEALETRTEPAAYQTVYQPDPDLSLDEQRILQAGQAGTQAARIRIRYEDGREVSRVLLDSQIIEPAIDEIISYGTQVTMQAHSIPDGSSITYWRAIPVVIHVDSTLAVGTAAADPDVISPGTWIYIDGYGQAEVVEARENTGFRLMIGESDYPLPADSVMVYLLPPLPADIPYQLPE